MLWLQIDGVAMSSLLGLVLVNIFMGYYETLWLNSFRECEIILLDDMLMILCLFNCESDTDKFFEFLNTQCPNIKSHLKNKLISKFHF